MKMKNKTLYLLIIIVSIFGIILAGTLTLAKYSDSIAIICGEDQSNSCNTVQNSPYSYLINEQISDNSSIKIPLTLAGVVFYTILTILTIILYLNETGKVKLSEIKHKYLRYALFGSGILGVVFSSWFVYIQANLIKAFCKYCLVSAFDTLVLLVLITIVLFFTKDKVKVENKKKAKK